MTKELDLKLTVVFSSEEFKKQAETINSEEELRDLLVSYGVDINSDEVHELCLLIGKQVSIGQGDELDEKALENVAGGFGIITWTCIGIGALCIGGFALGVYNGYKATAASRNP